MPKRSSKPGPRDPNETAAAIVAAATGETTMANPPPGALDPRVDPPRPKTTEDFGGKNPAAVLLGRLGGAKGGPARAAALSGKKRKAIAKKAAAARWKKTQGSGGS
jgi:hypothetical protein